MQRKVHALPGDVPGTERSFASHHFGRRGSGPKAYLQAGLHSDELPGQLVLWHLAARLQALEPAGAIRGEIVVVPCANPIGLSQGVMWDRVGRFDLYSGENFNRQYPDLDHAVGDRVEGLLGPDAQANRAIIRRAFLEALAGETPRNELAALRRAQLLLAADADVVLDLHCDLEAIVHLYTTRAGEAQAKALSRHLGAPVLLIADDSGVSCFDETCSTLWDTLQARFRDRYPIPAACFAATIELRGQADVSDELASTDAARLLDWLAERGFVATAGARAPTGAFEAGQSTPLSGSQVIAAPAGGIVCFRAGVGQRLHAGEAIAELVDPMTGARVAVTAQSDGVLYAREHRRFVRRGTTVALVTGTVPVRSGNLLSA